MKKIIGITILIAMIAMFVIIFAGLVISPSMTTAIIVVISGLIGAKLIIYSLELIFEK